MLPKRTGIYEATTKLKAMRLKRGLSQRELSDKSGVNINTIKALERKSLNIDNSGVKNLYRICKALNCKLSDITESNKVYKMLKEIM